MTRVSQLASVPSSPYKGLNPYSEGDVAFFFGRERWRDIIINNLFCWSLTLLYGPSGVGKSSLLRAGVAAQLRQQAQENLTKYKVPVHAVIVFPPFHLSWQDKPLPQLKEQIEQEIGELAPNIQPPEPELPFIQTLQAWTELLGGEEGDGELFIILDQFEEYLLYYHSSEAKEGTFAVEFPRAVNCHDLPVHFLISIREDALAKLLDHFKGSIPGLLNNSLHIEHLDQESARNAIKKPIEVYNRCQAMDEQQFEIEESLIKTVLHQTMISHPSEHGGVETSPEEQIEAPYLQLVMTRLWEEEIKKGSQCLRLETLNKLGSVKAIAEGHLNERIKLLTKWEQDIASSIFQYLVTPSGIKLAHSVYDLAALTGVDENQLIVLLEKLSSSSQRILRPVKPLPNQPSEARRYEIFHEVLAPAILDWQRQYKELQARRSITIQRLRILAVVVGVLSSALLILLAI